MKKNYISPTADEIVLKFENVILTNSELNEDNSTDLGGDEDPKNEDPWG